jgi:hypothetical protein
MSLMPAAPLSRDIVRRPEEIAGIEVMMTVVGGAWFF